MLDKLLGKFKSDTGIPLWTKDYTILTVGSAISYMGSYTMFFILGLLVLDYSNSILFYSLFLFLYDAVKIIVPILSGPYLDRFSRRKTIYTLDFISASLYFCIFLLIDTKFFGYGIIAAVTVIVATIDSIYRVAFRSMFPMLVHEKNLTKAYSVFSIIETISYVMIPVATFFYRSFPSTKPIFLFGAITFAVAATTEVFIKVKEEYKDTERSGGIKRYVSDFKEGITLVNTNKALLIILISYIFVYIIAGMQNSILLPHFRNTYANGEYLYMFAMGASLSGRFMGGFVLYFITVSKKRRYLFTAIGMLLFAALNMATLFLPILAIFILQYWAGISDSVSYNFQSSATMAILPDGQKGRYNGMFSTFANFGLLCGDLLGGVLSGLMLLKWVNFYVCLFCAAAVFILLFIIGRKPLQKLFL
ncbi:MAG: MFS transporter [Clostridia bacterium]|nr:MFS transporter [Clostridia bacterium]